MSYSNGKQKGDARFGETPTNRKMHVASQTVQQTYTKRVNSPGHQALMAAIARAHMKRNGWGG